MLNAQSNYPLADNNQSLVVRPAARPICCDS